MSDKQRYTLDEIDALRDLIFWRNTRIDNPKGIYITDWTGPPRGAYPKDSLVEAQLKTALTAGDSVDSVDKELNHLRNKHVKEVTEAQEKWNKNRQTAEEYKLTERTKRKPWWRSKSLEFHGGYIISTQDAANLYTEAATLIRQLREDKRELVEMLDSIDTTIGGYFGHNKLTAEIRAPMRTLIAKHTQGESDE